MSNHGTARQCRADWRTWRPGGAVWEVLLDSDGDPEPTGGKQGDAKNILNLKACKKRLLLPIIQNQLPGSDSDVKSEHYRRVEVPPCRCSCVLSWTLAKVNVTDAEKQYYADCF